MKQYYYPILVLLVTLALLAPIGSNVAFAQSPNVQKALEDVRTKLDDLVTTKDENPTNDLALRIATYKKVLSFAIAEAEDLKIKLVTVEEQEQSPKVKQWKEEVLEDLNAAITFYRSEEKALQENTATLSSLRTRAEIFKTFREETFLPLADTIQDFLLLNHEERVLEVAKRRLQKIREDVKKLEAIKFKGAGELRTLFEKADETLVQGEEAYQAAWKLFGNTYIVQPASTTIAEAPEATSTEITDEETQSPEALPLSLATSSDKEAGATSSQPSIKDLAKHSLDAVQETYRIFIEMSNLVRKLLK